jgi:hypothetical protein
MSCVTCPKDDGPDPVSVVVDAIEFPVFPDSESVTFDGNTVKMPLDIWLSIVDYVLEIEKIKMELKASQDAKEGST